MAWCRRPPPLRTRRASPTTPQPCPSTSCCCASWTSATRSPPSCWGPSRGCASPGRAAHLASAWRCADVQRSRPRHQLAPAAGSFQLPGSVGTILNDTFARASQIEHTPVVTLRKAMEFLPGGASRWSANVAVAEAHAKNLLLSGPDPHGEAASRPPRMRRASAATSRSFAAPWRQAGWSLPICGILLLLEEAVRVPAQ